MLDNYTLYEACQNGDHVIVLSLLNKPSTLTDLNRGLSGACESGDRILIDLMIEKGANCWDLGMYGACEGGHRDLVDLMIEKGADSWDWGLMSACMGGSRDIVDLMIKKGASYWNFGLCGACHGGYRTLVDLMIENGAYDLNWGLVMACVHGHRDIVDLLIEKGATELKCVVSHFNNDKRYIAHVALRLEKQRRIRFIDTLRQEKHDSTIVYLTNHHLIRCASSSRQPLQSKKRILRNVLRQFVCSDVATFSCRFVGVFLLN